jgi:hypothetical protein
MIDCVLLAEFDIKLGSTVRIQFPCPVAQNPDLNLIANYMLPEGGHNFLTMTTFFTLNRPTSD